MVRWASSRAAASTRIASRPTPLKALIVPAIRMRLSKTPDRASSDDCCARASAAVSDAVSQMKAGSMSVEARIRLPASQLWVKTATRTITGVSSAAARPGSH